MPSNLKLRQGTVEDVDDMAEVYLSAFDNDIISRRVFPRESGTGKAFWRTLLADEFAEHAHFLVITEEATETIVAFAKWMAPGAPVEDAPGPGIWPHDGDRELAVRFFGALSDGHRRTMGEAPHWYLEIIAVRREWMGHGAAGQLMEWGLDRADQERQPCYLDSTPGAKAMYEKYGFHTEDERVVPTPEGDAVSSFMVRNRAVS